MTVMAILRQLLLAFEEHSFLFRFRNTIELVNGCGTQS